MAYPLKVGVMSRSLRDIKNKRARHVRDKNNPGKWVDLPCSFGKKGRDGNYIVNVTLVHQIRARTDMKYQEVRDTLALVFLMDKQLLVVMGRDGIEEAV